jgi:hypothetical protein
MIEKKLLMNFVNIMLSRSICIRTIDCFNLDSNDVRTSSTTDGCQSEYCRHLVAERGP